MPRETGAFFLPITRLMNKNFLWALFLLTLKAGAQPTIGLLLNSAAATDGYTLFAPMRSNTTYLVDNCGHSVNEWTSIYKPGASVYFLPDGKLMRSGSTNNVTFTAGGSGGAIEEFDWNGNLTWDFLYSDFTHCQHHDIHPMPNGHVLAIAWEKKTEAEAIAAGRNPANVNMRMFTEEVIEVDPVNDSIVWRWNVWDHNIQDYDSTKSNFGIIADHPELVDINFFTASPDVYHVNGIDYNPVLDQIILSAHNYDEVWIIDHTTTTIESASHAGGKYGHGGDLLYRWGNPLVYHAGTSADQKLFGQHNPQWIPDSLRYGGSLLVFNNGLGRPGLYSSVEIIEPPQDSAGYYQYTAGLPFDPSAPSWVFTCNPPSAFYSPLISGVQPLENGHYLICEGDNGVFTEIDSSGDTLWKYINPVDTAPRIQGVAPFNNSVFRCRRFSPTYAGFNGQVLIPGNLIEQNPLPDTCTLFTEINNEEKNKELNIFPNPVEEKLTVKGYSLFGTAVEISIYNMPGELMNAAVDCRLSTVDCRLFPPGIYFLKIHDEEKISVFKFIKQ